MSDTPTLDFFDRLEAELRRAASRPPRRRLTVPPAAVLVAVLAIGALALIPIALLGGGERQAPSQAGPGLSPVGSILPKGSGQPPRRHTSMVVARGAKSAAGPWQLEVSRIGSRHPKPGHAALGHCLMLYLPATPGNGFPSLGGYCAPWKRQLASRTIAEFAMYESPVPPGRPRTVVVFGRAPARASKVRVSLRDRLPVEADVQPAPPGFERRYGFDATFYAVVLRTTALDGARVNWLDVRGAQSSRGIPLFDAPLRPPRP